MRYRYAYEAPAPPPTQRSGFPTWAVVLILMFIIVPVGVVGLTVATAVALPAVLQGRIEQDQMEVQKDLREITGAILSYHEIHDEYPTGLDQLAQPDAAGVSFLSSEITLLDPWDRPYLFSRVGTYAEGVPVAYTLGMDGSPGGDGINRDFDNVDYY